MDEGEALKTGVSATMQALIEPLADLIRKIAGPGAEEFGLTIKDHVRVFRFKRQVRLLQQTQAFIADIGREPHHVPLKVLAPIFENATLEEEDELQDRWAALLANAATGDSVVVGYAEVLKQLSKHDITLLRELFREAYLTGMLAMPVNMKQVIVRNWEWRITAETSESFETGRMLTAKTIGTFVRLGLCNDFGGSRPDYELWTFDLSRFGYEFVLACESPEFLRKLEEKKANEKAENPG